MNLTVSKISILLYVSQFLIYFDADITKHFKDEWKFQKLCDIKIGASMEKKLHDKTHFSFEIQFLKDKIIKPINTFHNWLLNNLIFYVVVLRQNHYLNMLHGFQYLIN